MGIYLGGIDVTWYLPALSLVGSLLIGRLMAGTRGKRTLIGWAVAPFVAYLAYALLPGNDEFLAWLPLTWPILAVLWVPALLVGALFGRRLRRMSEPLG
ncbi:hypothetical protein GRI89_03680 [Altererythrobacter salegens]|uniref:Uncharacterized protein n=1 Tax=Croceibacterium salegens TaxID=1737568 RepID=A0A6I4SRN9_9SPHN|nr:hypothetical protein [Croceibacterium salegens]MXO58641.1 hypothetical protein [Croceibacterium salegens]